MDVIILKTLLKVVISIAITIAILEFLVTVLTLTGGVAGFLALIIGGMIVLGIFFKVYETLFGSSDESQNKIVYSDNNNVTKNTEELQRSNVEFNSGLRESLFLELNKNPQIIKNSTSAITKTICANLEMNDDEAKNKVSRQIDIIKKVYELYKSGFNINQIVLRIQVHENEKILESEVESILNMFKSIE